MYGVVRVSLRMMGMWSDDISWAVRQEIRMASEGDEREMSGEVFWFVMLYGLRVGVWGQLRMERE